MTLEEALKEFESGYRLCLALGMQPQSYTYWKSAGELPELQQWRLQHYTKGRLKIDAKYIRRLGKETDTYKRTRSTKKLCKPIEP